jgi:hypothetical protein
MKTDYGYIKMVKVKDLPKTSVWHVANKKSGDLIGGIHWNPGWRQYCFFPYDLTVFSAGCLNDIVSFIADLKAGVP